MQTERLRKQAEKEKNNENPDFDRILQKCGD